MLKDVLCPRDSDSNQLKQTNKPKKKKQKTKNKATHTLKKHSLKDRETENEVDFKRKGKN